MIQFIAIVASGILRKNFNFFNTIVFVTCGGRLCLEVCHLSSD